MKPVACERCGVDIWSAIRKVCPPCKQVEGTPVPPPSQPKPSVLDRALADLRAGPQKTRGSSYRRTKLGERYTGGVSGIRRKKGKTW